MHSAAWRYTASAGLIALLLAICLRVPHLHRSTVALTMILIIVGLAKKWGWLECLIAAIVAGVGFDYYLLPPRGLGVATFEDLIDLTAFVVTAIVVGQLVARSKRLRIDAVARKNELERLHKIANAMLCADGPKFSLIQLANQFVDIFETDVALYDRRTGEIARSGPRAIGITDRMLREPAAAGRQVTNAGSVYSLIPLHHGGDLIGSIGVQAAASQALVDAIGIQVGMGLARLHSIAKTVDAEAARQYQELKAAALDSMAHDIRNPLNSIRIGVTALLSEYAGSNEDRRTILTIVKEEADRMDRLLDDSLQMARVEASEFSLNKMPQDIARLIPAVIKEMGESAARRSIEVSVTGSLPPAECDRDMIARVLRRLLGNALKYSPPDSPLAVSAEFTGAAVVIDVVDRGPGIDDDERDRIFERFYRGRAAKTGIPGTGLGLASARSIVRAHGGEIWVTTPPAGGAAFHVSLPATNAAAVAAGAG